MKIRQSSYRHVARQGFTIIEMVVVLAIIGILLGIAVKSLGGAQDLATETQVKSELAAISSALLMYKTSGGYYPTQAQGLKALQTKPTTAPIPKRWTKNETVTLIDPWGADYVYKFPGSKNRNQPEVISKGPDGQLGTEDDFSSQDMK